MPKELSVRSFRQCLPGLSKKQSLSVGSGGPTWWDSWFLGSFMPEIVNPMPTGGFLQPSTNTDMLFHSVSEPSYLSLSHCLCSHRTNLHAGTLENWHNNDKARSPMTLYEVIGQERVNLRVLYPIEQHRGEQQTLLAAWWCKDQYSEVIT